MRQKVSSDVFNRLHPDGFNLRLLPSAVLKESNTLPLKTEGREHAFVEVLEVSILPIASRVIGLHLNEVVAQVDA